MKGRFLPSRRSGRGAALRPRSNQTRLSAGSITGLPLEESAWRRFYDEELPESRGSPVLVRDGAPHWGLGVFPLTLWVALRGAMSAGRRGS